MRTTQTTRSIAALACALTVLPFIPARVIGGTQVSSPEALAISEEAYLYGLPIVMNYAVMYENAVDPRSGQYKAPFNQIKQEAPALESDISSSVAWLDLRAQPIVLSVPAMEKTRYYSIMLCDGNTFNYGYIGSRATGSDAGQYMVVGPYWNGTPPPGIKKVFRSTTQFSRAAFRTQLYNREDMPNVAKIQAGYKIQTLAQVLKKRAPDPPPAINFPEVNGDLVKPGFLEYLDFALQFAPPGPEEFEIRAKLALIGVGPGKTFEFNELSPERKADMVVGMQAGADKIEEYLKTASKDIHGWKVGSLYGDRTFFNGDWLMRAAAAKEGLYGDGSVEAMVIFTKTLEDGEALDAGAHDYKLTFRAGQLPPVKAFWSLTLLDAQGLPFIKNPINRCLINSAMLPGMIQGTDGSLAIHLQKDSPGAEKESNWLPAPNGPLSLVMRLYWPTDTPPSILPTGEGTWQPPAIEKMK